MELIHYSGKIVYKTEGWGPISRIEFGHSCVCEWVNLDQLCKWLEDNAAIIRQRQAEVAWANNQISKYRTKDVRIDLPTSRIRIPFPLEEVLHGLIDEYGLPPRHNARTWIEIYPSEIKVWCSGDEIPTFTLRLD